MIYINNIEELAKLKLLSKKNGKTKVTVHISESNKTYIFQLNDKRRVDHKLINTLKIRENIEIN